jgi:putative endopeptidase
VDKRLCAVKARIQQVTNLYSTFTVLGISPNGINRWRTADIAGIAVAYDAFKMTEEGKECEN